MIKIETNFKDFKYGIMVAGRKIEGASESGMEIAMKTFLDDCQNVPPKVPRRTGDLAGSHSIFVGSRLVGTSTGGRNPTPLRVFVSRIGGIVGTLIVHKPYAASIHEGVSRHGTPYKYKTAGTGKKWVEFKLIAFANKYFSLIARRIRGTT